MFLLILALSSISLINLVNGNCAPCPEIPKHYEELGCKGVFSKEGGCCPERFECPEFAKYNTTQCHLKGRSYDDGEEAEDGAPPKCSAACRCLTHGEEANFNCANIECPDLFNAPKPDCINQYSFDHCCSIKEICGKEEQDKLHKCNYHGRDYFEGQKIYPENGNCYECICDADFNNETSIRYQKSCKKVDCGIELRYLNEIQKGCVPVYFGDNGCCPITFRCPEKDDSIIPVEGRSEIVDDPEFICKFNELEIKRGEKLNATPENKCVECSCINPPMVECRQKANC